MGSEMCIRDSWRGFPSSIAEQPKRGADTERHVFRKLLARHVLRSRVFRHLRYSRCGVFRHHRGSCDTHGNILFTGVRTNHAIHLYTQKSTNIITKPSNSPTQGQFNPTKIRFEKRHFGHFSSHSKSFLECWDWFYIGNRLRESPSMKASPADIRELCASFLLLICSCFSATMLGNIYQAKKALVYKITLLLIITRYWQWVRNGGARISDFDTRHTYHISKPPNGHTCDIIGLFVDFQYSYEYLAETNGQQGKNLACRNGFQTAPKVSQTCVIPGTLV